MKVKLMQYTPEPERTVAMAARLCYSAVGAEELAEKMSQSQVAGLVSKIVELGHLSTLEHVNFTFAVEGISRVLSHQLVRHRIASYSQQSQRYVGEHDFEAIVPPSIAARPEAAAKFAALMAQIRTAYEELTDLGIPKEDARYVLANATETKVVITMNARTLLHFFSLRCCMRAQWEIRAMAEAMLKEARQAAPLLFAKAGPTCLSAGYCSEGKMSCGRAQPLPTQS
ncbi:FAD-dependent thymidylate synthase [Anaeromusa sp.]|uniref:FAD-dependent thymidylate synthase n=1 Tax=Anaeromusa sp. TaxID=1872520 RepID=UPI0026323AE6|nr:FAD-dependent thymidylate synthase [Anaeromusa sp.]MDD3156573.1 FAD-dependent thymidylate synthase [Anaeromusa sp.]